MQFSRVRARGARHWRSTLEVSAARSLYCASVLILPRLFRTCRPPSGAHGGQSTPSVSMPAAPSRRWLHWLTGATCLTAVSSQAPLASAIPYSKCIGCEQAALLSVHFVSKEFYCHPDGSKADTSCAAAHGSPAACCAACLKVNAEKKMCDAWFMNEQGGCFFKNCPPSAWKSGECHIDPKPSPVRSEPLRHLPRACLISCSAALTLVARDYCQKASETQFCCRALFAAGRV